MAYYGVISVGFAKNSCRTVKLAGGRKMFDALYTGLDEKTEEERMRFVLVPVK
jgi:hypothetical protein